MKNKNERGFSIIELLVVCVVIGIIAVIAVPHLQKGIVASENGNMYATMRTIATTQATYYSQNNRYGRLSEINNILGSSIGTPSGNDIIRGKFTISMAPATPTDLELRNGFTILATRVITGEGLTYIYTVTESGLDPL